VPAAARLEVTQEVAVRYEGQSYELYVPFPAGPLDAARLKRIAAQFGAAYGSRYHALPEQNRLETVRWRVRVTALERGSGLDLAMPAHSHKSIAIKGRRAVYVAERSRFMNCPVYDRYALPAGYAIAGPAVVEEAESTVYLGPDAKAVVTRQGDLSVMLGGRAQAGKTRSRVTSNA